MRILVQTLGSAGDVHPFIGLGAALRARGHDVHVLANEVFGDAVRGAGLTFVESGSAEAFRAAQRDPDLWHPRKGLEAVMRHGVFAGLDETVDRLAERVVPGGTVLLASSLGFASRLLWESEGIPLVMAHLTPGMFRSVHRPPRYAGMPDIGRLPASLQRAVWWLVDVAADRIVRPHLDPARAGLGLPPVRRVFGDWSHTATALIGLFPAWFAPPPPDWPANLQLAGFPLFDESSTRAADPDLDRWLDGGDAPIVFTAGSANIQARRFFAASVEAAALLGRRALLLTTDPTTVPSPLPPTVRHETYTPFSRVVPRAAAFVHHGGIGSCAQGLAAGVPQLTTPMGFDQFENTSRLVDLGVAASLPARRYTAARAATELRRLLDSSDVQAACAHAAARIRETDAAAIACDAIENAARASTVRG